VLKDLALAAKVDAHALKVADDVDNVKAEVIRLILEAKGRGKPSAPPPQKIPEKQPAEDVDGKDASSSDSDSDSDSSDSDEDVEDSSSSDDSDDDSDNDAAEESGEEEEEGDGVIAQLQRFKRSTELVLLLHDTTAAERGAVHSWCEEHSDAAVRAWKHTSKTVGTSRVMTVVKPGGDANSVQKAPEKPVQIAEPPAKRPRKEPEGDAGPRRFEDGKHILFVGQLPYDATTEHISAHFTTAHAVEIMGGAMGVVSVRLLTDKKTSRSRGMAFVDCTTEEDCDKGLHMHQSKLLGRRINVERSASGGGKSERRARFIETSKSRYGPLL